MRSARWICGAGASSLNTTDDETGPLCHLGIIDHEKCVLHTESGILIHHQRALVHEGKSPSLSFRIGKCRRYAAPAAVRKAIIEKWYGSESR